MGNKPKCRCGSDEHAHLCMLRSNLLHDEIERITSKPEFYCFICGGEANCADNVCEPAQIKK